MKTPTVVPQRHPAFGGALTKALFIVLTLIMLCACSYLSWDVYQLKADHQARVKQEIETETLAAANTIRNQLSKQAQRIDLIAKELALQSVTPENAKALTETYFAKYDELASLAIALKPAPNSYTSDAFYIERLTSNTPKRHTLKNYHVDEPQFNWYSRPLKEGPIWTEPYYEAENDVLMTTYSVPLLQAGSDVPIGVIPTDVNLQTLTNSLKAVPLGKTGYAMLFSESGRLLSHPVFDLVKEAQTWESLAKDSEFSFLSEKTHCQAGSDGVSVTNTTDKNLFVGCIYIDELHWTLLTVFSEREAQVDPSKLKRHYLLIFASATFLLVGLFTLTWGTYNSKAMGKLAATFYTSVFVVAIMATWYVARMYYPTHLSDDAIQVLNKTDRNAFVSNYIDRSHEKHEAEPISIRTGLHIQSIEARSAHNIFLTGYVWQVYLPEFLETLEPGIVFPESVSASIEPAYQETNSDGSITYGWYFEVEVRQPFDYGKYPFDTQHVWLRIWHHEFNKNVILVPDIESYSHFSPIHKPGLTDKLVLSGWQAVASSFNFVEHSYNENFGINNYRGSKDVPELYYDVVVQRSFLSPFITTLLPALVIASLLFAAVVSLPKSDVNEERNTGGALMFTILLAHFSLREYLDLNGVVYFESFYFVLYGLISALLGVSYYYYHCQNEQNKDKIYKLSTRLYWPVFSGVIFIITLVTYL